MNFNEYRDFVASRSIYPGAGGLLGACYVSLKMAGEAGELLDHVKSGSAYDFVRKEQGDVLWYVIAAGRELDIDLQVKRHEIAGMEQFSCEDWACAVSIAVSKFTECLGKAMRDDGYGLPASRLLDERKAKLKQHLEEVLFCIAGCANSGGETLQAVAKANMEKLRDRDARGVTKGDGDSR